MHRACLLLLVVAAPAAARGDELVDDALRAQLLLLSDGHGHDVALALQDPKARLFYGDDKRLVLVPTDPGENTGATPDGNFTRRFLDPRFPPRAHIKDWRDIDKSVTALERAGGKFVLRCGTRRTPLSLVDAAQARTRLASARFEAMERRRAHALARDEKGRYYYVDRGDSAATEKSYRVFVGPKGALKRQKMVNVIDDSEGQMFVTVGGKLRLLVGKDEAAWIQPEERRTLKNVPIDENLPMIFGELGVYTGERLGTPCDDL